MKKLILILLLHGNILSLSAQNDYLLLTKERKLSPTATTVAGIIVTSTIDYYLEKHGPKLKPIERKIKEGALIKVRCYSMKDKKIKGNLDILNDSLISAGIDTISLFDIKKISVRTTCSKISGPVITIAGAVGTIFMVPIFTETLALLSEEGLAVLAGAFLTPLAGAALAGCAIGAVAGIIYFISGNVYDTRGNYVDSSHGWHLQVARNYPIRPSRKY